MRQMHEERGAALILVLLMIALLTILIAEYAYETQVEASLVSNSRTQYQAYLAAKSAIAQGQSLLAYDLMDPESLGTTYYDGLQDVWAQAPGFEQFNEAMMQCDVADEYGKINLNALIPRNNQNPGAASYLDAVGANGQNTSGNGTTNNSSGVFNAGSGGGVFQGQRKELQNVQVGSGLSIRGQNTNATDLDDEELLQEERVNETLEFALRSLFLSRNAEVDPTDAILDWLDSDDETRPEGAEYDYYTTQELGYSCKNAPMDSLDELLLIKGITPEMFFGDREAGFLPLTELLTVHGNPNGTVNLNTAEYETLLALGEAVGQTGLADSVLSEREIEPFMSREDMEARGFTQPQLPQPELAGLNARGNQQRQSQAYGWSSEVFRVRGHGISGESKVRIEAYVERQYDGNTAQFRILDWRVFE
ncbi:MAG: general secretion pathway protein GspK [Candidatus Hydrogenedentes bacterium]|nr:general secretion pathway protein GspK [Candidatus Hydrogenedentota bacterium]